MPSTRSTFALGDPKALARIIANYHCGHCTGEVDELTTNTDDGLLRAAIRHDHGCPVLAGVLPAAPDLTRAAIPDTFRP